MALLERWQELTDPVWSPGGVPGGGVPLMPHEPGCLVLRSRPPRCSCARRSVVEVERLLRRMREDRSCPLVVLPSGEKVSVRALGWHVRARYVDCVRVTRDVSASVRDRRGKRRTVVVRAVVDVYDRGVRGELVGRGVEWLAASWGLGSEPMLPAELRRVA